MASGGGPRPPDYIYEMAIGRTEDLMRQGIARRRMFAILTDEGYTDSEDTVRHWRAEVQRRWAIEDAAERPARKDLWRNRLESLYQSLLERAEQMPPTYAQAAMYGEAIKVAKLSIQMDGVASPVVIRHEGGIDVAAMSPMEREAEIAKLLERRNAALAAMPRTPTGGN